MTQVGRKVRRQDRVTGADASDDVFAPPQIKGR